MTAPQGWSNPFAGGSSTPSISFDQAPFGTTYVLEVTELPELVQARDFRTKEPKTWPDGNPVMSAVVKGTVKSGPKDVGEVRSLWAQKPSALFRAIQEAQDTAGAEVLPGAILTVAYTHDAPPKNGGNPAKQYRVTLQPAGAFGAPAAQQAPAAQFVQPQQASAQQYQQAPATNIGYPPATVAQPAQQAAPAARPVLPAATLQAMATAGLDISGFDSAG